MKDCRMYIAYSLLVVVIGSCCLAFAGVDRTIIGLSQNILGTIIVAVFGIPQPDFSKEIALALSIPDEEERLKKVQEKRKFWHMACSYLGVALLIIGFAVQLWQYLSQRG